MSDVLKVGQVITVGWNGAKNYLGDEDAAYKDLIVEAVGFDWAVFRDHLRIPYTATFSAGVAIIEELES